MNDKVLDFGTQVTRIKIDAHLQERLNVEQYLARAKILLEQIEFLKQKLGAETDLPHLNQDLIGQLVLQRMDVEFVELGALKNHYHDNQRKVEEDYQFWKRRM
jgi:hypothetical protein